MMPNLKILIAFIPFLQVFKLIFKKIYVKIQDNYYKIDTQ